jgi:hypothetical protein
MSKLTKWELGQDLIAISDYIGNKEKDIRDSGNTKLANQLRVIRILVGDLFIENNDHEFGIINSSSDLVEAR